MKRAQLTRNSIIIILAICISLAIVLTLLFQFFKGSGATEVVSSLPRV